jgi:hypothetical protein
MNTKQTIKTSLAPEKSTGASRLERGRAVVVKGSLDPARGGRATFFERAGDPAGVMTRDAGASWCARLII